MQWLGFQLDDDLDTAVLRLEHAVAGLNQKALLAHADHVIACAGTLARTKASFTAFGRRSDNAMLHAFGPDVSMWPVAVMRAFPAFAPSIS